MTVDDDDPNGAYIDWPWPLNECARVVDVTGVEWSHCELESAVKHEQILMRAERHDTVDFDPETYWEDVLSWGGFHHFPPFLMSILKIAFPVAIISIYICRSRTRYFGS